MCLLAAMHVQADPVDAEAARQKAAAFLQGQKAKGARRRAPAARQLTLETAGKEGSYYIFNAKDGQGYVVVSGEDATEDILGYSNSGTIDTTFMPCGMKMLLDGYTEQIAFLRRNGIKRRQNSEGSDDDTPVTSYTIAESRRCRFDQNEPYNASCHKVNGEPTWTGCVATALAGLMYAYQWPNATTAVIPSYTYTSKSDTEETVEAVPVNTAIDWAHVEKQYCTRYYEDDDLKFRPLEGITPEQRTAVATLMMLAGNSVESKYNVTGTTAKTSKVPAALKEYFAYNDAVRYVERTDLTAEEWLSAMREEIVNHGPVMYCGEYTTKAGERHSHAFLLEGFNGNHFLVNFGWSGEHNNDAWFRLEAAAIDDAPLVYYPYKAGAVIDVKPIAHCDVEASELYLDNGNPDDGFFTGTTLTGSITFHNKSESDDAKIIYLLRLTDSSTGSNVRTKQYLMNLAPDGSTTQSFTYSNLTIGHRYVLKAIRLFGEEFYTSPELLCKEDPAFAEDDETPGNETLTRFEYWFDNDYSDRYGKKLVTSKAVLGGSINTNHLQIGLHFLHFRVQRNDGRWSGISSSPFMKLGQSCTEARFDYWLDDDYENRVSLPLDLDEDGNWSEDEQLLTLDLSGFDIGLHQLCYQVSLPGLLPSAVQRTAVMKIPTGTKTILECWYDDNEEHAFMFKGVPEEDDCLFFEKQLNMSSLPVGLHRLNFRAITINGLKRSAVMSVNVMKVPLGKGTGLEYWYDDDEAHAVTLQGVSEDNYLVYENQLNMSSLPVGLHRLTFRATSSDGQLKSPPVTCHVMKLPSGTASQMEYWFDDDMAHAKPLSGRTVDATGDYVYVSTLDMKSLSIGPHRLNFRAITINGLKRSALMSVNVMKVPIGKGTRLEYWYDDDKTHAVTLQGMSEDDCLVYESQLNMSSLPVGLHRLNFRAISSDGQLKSPLVTCYVMRNVTGSISRLEYWFDYDRNHVYTMEGRATEAGTPGYIFNGNLNISGLRPGHHRLHYRGIGSDGQLSTATGSASILVKLDGHGDAVLASYSVSVDGGAPVVQGALSASKEVLFSYVLDAKDLEKGWHTLQTTFWNSYGMSVTEATPFEVLYGDDDAVSTPQADEEADGPIYNLSGMRVNANAKGILIKNGKKFFVK